MVVKESTYRPVGMEVSSFRALHLERRSQLLITVNRECNFVGLGVFESLWLPSFATKTQRHEGALRGAVEVTREQRSHFRR